VITRLKPHVVFWATLVAGVGADLVSKHIVFALLSGPPERMRELWPGVFRLELRRNLGGVWSLLRGHNTVFVVVTVLALGVIVALYLREARRGLTPTLVALSLVAGGAIGNLCDRVAFGHVRDFLSFYCINYPVFNVADILITAGAILLAVELLLRRPEPAMTTPAPR
jgi:signal peptidase II